MKKFVLILLTCVNVLTLIAQDYETDFREIQRLFQERATTTPKRLDQHLDTYPYTPYRDEIKLLQGVLEVEKDKYSQALKIFNEITPTNLSRTSETMFYFHLGYTYLNMDKYDERFETIVPKQADHMGQQGKQKFKRPQIIQCRSRQGNISRGKRRKRTIFSIRPAVSHESNHQAQSRRY